MLISKYFYARKKTVGKVEAHFYVQKSYLNRQTLKNKRKSLRRIQKGIELKEKYIGSLEKDIKNAIEEEKGFLEKKITKYEKKFGKLCKSIKKHKVALDFIKKSYPLLEIRSLDLEEFLKEYTSDNISLLKCIKEESAREERRSCFLGFCW